MDQITLKSEQKPSGDDGPDQDKLIFINTSSQLYYSVGFFTFMFDSPLLFSFVCIGFVSLPQLTCVPVIGALASAHITDDHTDQHTGAQEHTGAHRSTGAQEHT